MRREDDREQRRERPREVEHERIVAARLGCAHDVVAEARLRRVRGVVDRGDRVRAVLRGERHAVGKLQTVAQVIGDRQTVATDPAVLQTGNLGCCVADQATTIIVLDEVLKEQLAPLGRRRPVLERRVERRRLALLRDGEDSRRVRTACRRRSARGEQDGDERSIPRSNETRVRRERTHRYRPAWPRSTI